MTTKASTILLVEDDEPQRKTLAGFLRKRGYEVMEAGSASEARAKAAGLELHLLLTDLRLGGPDGVTLLESLKADHPDLQALVLTAYGTVDDAVRAMRAGAYDFVAKPADLPRLEVLIEKALEKARLAEENRGLREVVKSSGVFADLIGESAAIRAVQHLAVKVAPSRASVLLLGESGTGKEVLARSIHLASPRRDKPFVVVNCAALPENLIEAELFGHEKGAFTGATAAKKGRFELADGGTFFLDEVGDIPLPVQVKLLGVIQSKRFERVGGTTTREVDVRIVSATHRDLEARIREGSFREDLYYRLNVVSITLPPLRERPDDIPLLIDHLLRKHRDLSSVEVESVAEEVLRKLRQWPFSGNVRELENCVERAVVLAEGPTLTAADFPPHLFEPAAPAIGSTAAQGNSPSSCAEDSDQGLEDQVARLETTLIQEALRGHGGNKSAAARDLKLSERAIRYKINKYGL